MKISDVIGLGIKGMSERKLRTGLTTLSVMIGVAAIVALISLVSGISASISSSLNSIGPSTIYLTPKGSAIFTPADVAEIESFPNVSMVIPMLRFSTNITTNGQSTIATVFGVSNASVASAIGGIHMYYGNLFSNGQLPEALIGYNIAFPTATQMQPSIMLNEPIYLNEQSADGSKTITLVPVGILQAYGSSLFVSPDTSIFISLPEAESMTNKYSYNVLLVQATNTSTANGVDVLLNDIYGSKASIISVQELASTVASITGSLSLLLGAIAGISLIVAGISILSIMMVSVSERTHEIGILKSIGFKRNDILLLFLSEALIIGILGGVLGIGLGAGVSYAIPSAFSGGSHGTTASTSAPARGGSAFGGGASSSSHTGSSGPSTLSFTPVISPTLIIMALLVAVLVSTLASLYPAWKASVVDPIKALRSE